MELNFTHKCLESKCYNSIMNTARFALSTFPLQKRAVIRRCTSKKVFYFKKTANFTGKHLCWSLFSTKCESWGPVTLLKRDYKVGASLCNLWIFWEHLFLHNTSGGFFFTGSCVFWKQPIVQKLLLEICTERPALLKYTAIYDVKTVFDAIRKFSCSVETLLDSLIKVLTAFRCL